MLLWKSRASVSRAKVTSSRWPASMLAKSRTASENGRTRKVDRNSIGVTRTYRALGTPGGKSVELDVAPKALPLEAHEDEKDPDDQGQEQAGWPCGRWPETG